MQAPLDQNTQQGPEQLVGRLRAQLRRQALWDSLLLFAPPLLAAFYIAGYLYRVAWIGPLTFFLLAAICAAAGLLAAALRYRPLAPSAAKAARLVDERAGAADRFLTLATLEAARSSAPLITRLRLEAGEFVKRVDPRRDFPYRIKKSFYTSLTGSFLGALLFYLLLPVADSAFYSAPAPQRLRELAGKLAGRPRLSEIARDLQALAVELEDPRVAREEKQNLVEEMQKKVAEQQKKEEQKEDRDLLGQAASTLKSLERQSGAGQEQQENQAKGGGGIQSSLPQQGQGEGKPSPGGSGDQQGDLSAQLKKEMQQGKTAQGDSKEQGNEKNQQRQGEGKGNQPDPNKPGAEKEKSFAGKSQGGADDRGGRGKTPEEIPQGGPPAERFYRAGEQGREGIKGARYVTVQLPEDAAANAQSDKSGMKNAKGSQVGSKVSASNVPLPAHGPDAPAEKQPMPLEYRGIIR